MNPQSGSQWDGLRHWYSRSSRSQQALTYLTGPTRRQACFMAVKRKKSRRIPPTLAYVNLLATTVSHERVQMGVGAWSVDGIVGRGVLLDFAACKDATSARAFLTSSNRRQEEQHQLRPVLILSGQPQSDQRDYRRSKGVFLAWRHSLCPFRLHLWLGSSACRHSPAEGFQPNTSYRLGDVGRDAAFHLGQSLCSLRR
jgi:hypothetical protein